MSTEPHWFVRPGVLSPDHPGTLNPIFEQLDHPIVLGRGDEICLTGRSHGGAEVELSYETALDRVAKLAGILQLMEVGPGVPVHISPEVPGLAARLARLAVIRIGGLVVADPTAEARVVLSAAREEAPARDVHQAFDKPVRRLPSHFEGVEISNGEQTVALDPIMRDARIEPGAAAELPADLMVVRQADGTEVTAREVSAEADWAE